MATKITATKIMATKRADSAPAASSTTSKSSGATSKRAGMPGRASTAARKSDPPPAASKSASSPQHRWTFLTNHAHVLILLSSNPSTLLRDLANTIGITERAVQRIIVDLEEDGFIEREKVGRKNVYKVLPNNPLRHPIESHRTIGDLIELIVNRA